MRKYTIIGIEQAQTMTDFFKSDKEVFKIKTSNMFSGNERVAVKYAYGEERVSITLPCDKQGIFCVAKCTNTNGIDRPIFIVFKDECPLFWANSPEFCNLFIAINKKGIKFANQVNWYVFDPKTKNYFNCVLESKAIKSRKLQVGGYEFVAVKNPYPVPGREYIVGEFGCGWILEYGETEEAAISAAKAKIGDLSQSDIGCYARGHIDLITRFCGKNPEFIAPTIYKRRAETV